MAKYCETELRRFKGEVKKNTKLNCFSSLDEIFTQSDYLTETQRKLGVDDINNEDKDKLFNDRQTIVKNMQQIVVPIHNVVKNADNTLKTSIGEDIVKAFMQNTIEANISPLLSDYRDFHNASSTLEGFVTFLGNVDKGIVPSEYAH